MLRLYARAWPSCCSASRPLVLLLAEEEEVGAALGAEDAAELAAAAVLAHPLEADRALRERHFLLVLLANAAVRRSTGQDG